MVRLLRRVPGIRVGCGEHTPYHLLRAMAPVVPGCLGGLGLRASKVFQKIPVWPHEPEACPYFIPKTPKEPFFGERCGLLSL